MRRILAAVAATAAAFLALAPAAEASGRCPVTAARVLETSTFFKTQMKRVEDPSSSVSMVSAADPRIAAIFGMRAPDAVDPSTSRAAYVSRLEARGAELASGAASSGVWADHSVYPYDPVAWRTVRETQVDGVGQALAAHMEIRFSADCLFVADFVAPNAINLRARWNELYDAVSNLRDSASPLVTQQVWAPDETTPTGAKAILVGVGAPLAAIALLFVLLGSVRQLDPPSAATRIVIASSGLVSLGTLLMLSRAYMLGLEQAKYVDGALVFAIVAAAAAAGAARLQSEALLALVTAFVGGVAGGVASLLSWTPDPAVTGAASGALVFLSVTGLYAWSEGTYAARLRKSREREESRPSEI